MLHLIGHLSDDSSFPLLQYYIKVNMLILNLFQLKCTMLLMNITNLSNCSKEIPNHNYILRFSSACNYQVKHLRPNLQSKSFSRQIMDTIPQEPQKVLMHVLKAKNISCGIYILFIYLFIFSVKLFLFANCIMKNCIHNTLF